MRLNKIASISAGAALIAATVFSGSAAMAAETITGTGASYTLSLQAECTAAYTAHKVTYVSKGSTTGRSDYTKGISDFGGSDIIFKTSETKPKNFTYVPLLGGPVAVSYNIAGLTRLNLTAAVISDIYLGKITKWNDKAIVALNESSKALLPDATITPVYRSDGSGTTANFTNYLKQVVGKAWAFSDAFKTAATGVVGVGASGNSAVATTIKSTANSFGYIDLADANKNALPIAHLKNGAGQFLKPTVANSKKFIEATSMKTNGEVLFDYNKKLAGAYNLSLVSYGIAPTKAGTAKADAVREYLTYFIKDCAPSKAAAIGFVALSGKFQTTALKLVSKVD
jgi:phosphate transport system substrate-binding protein